MAGEYPVFRRENPMIEMETDIKEKMLKLKKAMSEAADGKVIKREIAKELRGLMNPLVAEQRARVLRLPSKGGSHGQSMRQAIARQTKAATKWGGNNVGVQVIQRARGMPRNFQFAGRAFNRSSGWHPTSLGGETVHQQIRPAEWFDGATTGKRGEIGQKVHHALDVAADKIARSAH
jgi:hypothetical protein